MSLADVVRMSADAGELIGTLEDLDDADRAAWEAEAKRSSLGEGLGHEPLVGADQCRVPTDSG